MQRACYTSGIDGYELERVVAAPLQAGGWFLVRSAREFQAFELDVLGYGLSPEGEESIVVESKSGKSGFSDFFKLLGKKVHLGLDRGILLADPADPVHTRKVREAAKHDIAVIDQHPDRIADNLLAVDAVERETPPELLAVWQRCFRVEDALIKTLTDRDLWQKWSTIRLAKEQLQHLLTRGWMEPDAWKQAVKLYELYGQEPKIALRMVKEMAPGQWEYALRQAMYWGALEEVQACFYLEHRKRLAVAFAATRCALNQGEPSKWMGHAPGSFCAIVDRIRDEDAWYMPLVLQVYFLGFGGMICNESEDVEKQEFRELAKQACCTPRQARRALQLFEELFPYPDGGSWFVNGWDLSRLKLMPVPLRGAGIWMREAIYEDSWEELATSGQESVAGVALRSRAQAAEAKILPKAPTTKSRRKTKPG